MSDESNNPPAENFSARWNRRKLESRQNALTDDLPRESIESDMTSTPQELTDTAAVTPKTDADMPDLGRLENDDSYSDFLSEGVSKALRNKALKQLFHLSHFNITDNLDDYDDDYSVFEPLGDTVSDHLKQWLERDPANTHKKLEETEINDSDTDSSIESSEGAEDSEPAPDTTEPAEQPNTIAENDSSSQEHPANADTQNAGHSDHSSQNDPTNIENLTKTKT